MSRLPAVKREDLSVEDHEIWDEIARTHDGDVYGPYSALIYVPHMAERVSQLEAHFRTHGVLTAAERHVVICAVTKHHGAAFPFWIHDIRARDSGASEDVLQVVAAASSTESLPAREALLIDLARELCQHSTLRPAFYERAKAVLGERSLVEVVTLCGHYTLISYVCNTFDVQPGMPQS
jgi:4-carboxymuconolactone decarboxylase